MFQIAWGLTEDNMHAVWYNDLLRSLLSLFERVVFTLVGFLYQILITIANNTIISGDMIRDIFSRIQLILGIIMIFKLSVSVLQYIINPDIINDKSKGIGGIITRILVMLLLLTSIMPLNIPEEKVIKGSYNDYIRENGLLFGTLYSFQSRVLSTNVITNLILGKNEKFSSTGDMEKAGNQLSVFVLKSVIRKNDVICPRDEIDSGDNDKEEYDRYDNDDTLTPTELIDDMIDIACYTPWGGKDAKYAFSYFPFVGFIVGIFILLALFSCCVETAIRAIKLAILRIIAPVPIISYIDPKQAESGTFATWVKTVIKTYLDLFLRLAIIYFVIFVVGEIASGRTHIFDLSSLPGVFATIFIIVGLFSFARNAVPFIYDSLGIKREEGSGIFSGFGKLRDAGSTLDRIRGVGAGALGSIGSARTAREASINRGDGDVRRFLNTLAGGVGGFSDGVGAALHADDHATQAAMNAQARRNARTASGSTGFGRTRDSFGMLLNGAGEYENMQKDWEEREEALRREEADLNNQKTSNNYRKTMMDRVDSKTADSNRTTGTYKGITGNYRDYHSIFQAALGGVGTYKKYYDDSGNEISVDSYNALMPGEGYTKDYFNFNGQEVAVDQGTDIDQGLLDENKADYFRIASSDATFDNAFTDAMNDLEASSGAGAMASNLGNLKRDFGTYSHDISIKQQDITDRRNAIADEKSSPAASAAKANSEYRGGNNG